MTQLAMSSMAMVAPAQPTTTGPALTPTQQVFAALSLWDAVKADKD